jgi:hypothetical protein
MNSRHAEDGAEEDYLGCPAVIFSGKGEGKNNKILKINLISR